MRGMALCAPKRPREKSFAADRSAFSRVELHAKRHAAPEEDSVSSSSSSSISFSPSPFYYLSASSSSSAPAPAPARYVLVEVVRGDTARRYAWAVAVPSRDAMSGTSHCAGIARWLVDYVLDTILSRDRAWCLVFRGKDVRSAAGAELLGRTLMYGSDYRIALVAFFALSTA